MIQIPDYFSKEDALSFALPGLFESYGYKKYRMSKFEEYSFYSDNRNFLTDDGVIAFNNSDGRLMALKPDITLSIIKNAKLGEKLTKLYYNESVFRKSGATGDFKEIKQCGVEVIGSVDNYLSAEIIILAAKSLAMIDENFVLSISHNALLSSVLSDYNLDGTALSRILECIGSKNMHELKRICAKNGISEEATQMLCELSSVDTGMDEALSKISKYCTNFNTLSAYNELASLAASLKKFGFFNKIHIDLSVTMHTDYYNGLVFRGYVEKSPAAVLSGGRYDGLVKKLRDNTSAIGFAVYLDNLNLYYKNTRSADTDILIINKDSSGTNELVAEVEKFVEQGYSVSVESTEPETTTTHKIYCYKNCKLTEATKC